MDFIKVDRLKRKRKMMLWIDDELISELELMPPVDITAQEKIRQIVKSFLEEDVAEVDIAGL